MTEPDPSKTMSPTQHEQPVEHGFDERAQLEQLAKAHAALAAAQDRSYWLDRWELDLNELMRRPAARRVRAALRVLREVKRGTVSAERYAQQRLDMLRATDAEDEMAVDASTRGAAEPDQTGKPATEREPSSGNGSARA